MAHRNGKAVCDMEKDCAEPVTHLDEKGYVYCDRHAVQRAGGKRGKLVQRAGGKRVRKLRVWEKRRVEKGLTIPTFDLTHAFIAPTEEEEGSVSTCRACGQDYEARVHRGHF